MDFHSLQNHIVQDEFDKSVDELIKTFRKNYKQILLLLYEITKYKMTLDSKVKQSQLLEIHKSKALASSNDDSRYISDQQAIIYMLELRSQTILILSPEIMYECCKLVGSFSILIIHSFINIKSIPLKILYTNRNLKSLCIAQCNLPTLHPGMFSRLSALQVLEISNSNVEKLDPGLFKGLKNLGLLVICGNKITEIPEDMFEDLHSLSDCNLDRNCIKTIPPGLFNRCDRLKTINLSHNKIVSLPAGVFDNLVNLSLLNISNNKLTSIDPEIFRDCVELKELHLSENRITNPSSDMFQHFKKLIFLSLSSNRINELPPDLFSSVPNLVGLSISKNNFSDFPVAIFSLPELRVLDISINQLKVIPKEIQNLRMLESVNMESNRIEELPMEIKKLKYLNLFIIMANPVADPKSEFASGCDELSAYFGERFICKSYLNDNFEIVYKEDVYAALDSQRVHWNRKMLKEIQVDPIPMRSLSDQEILNIWKSDLYTYCNESYEKEKNIRENMDTYLNVLFSRVDVPDKLLAEYSTTKDLLEYIFKKLKALIPTDPDGVRSYLTILAHHMLFCQTGKKEGLDHLYAILSGTKDFNNIIGFIEHQIAVYKDMVFTETVTFNCPQNVHIVNHWRNKMKKKLGLRIEYTDRIGTMFQDMFRNCDGNMLQAFYENFTPEFMIEVLKKAINEKEQWLTAVTALLMGKDENSLKEYFEFSEKDLGEGITDSVTKEIKSEGVEQILLDLNILKRAEKVD